MLKNLALLVVLYFSGFKAASIETEPNQAVLNEETFVFENDFVSIDPDLNHALLSNQLLNTVPVASGFYDLPSVLQYFCLTYLDGQSLFSFSMTRVAFQCIAKMYACTVLSRTNCQLQASSVYKTLFFVSECLPRIEEVFPGFLRDRPLSWADLAWIMALTSLNGTEAKLKEIKNQVIFSQLARDLSKDERNSVYGAYALHKLGFSVKRLLKFLLANNCRQPEVYEYLLHQAHNLNHINLPQCEHILFQLIEDGMYFPALMERPELIHYTVEDALAEDFDGELEVEEEEPGPPEFYDLCYELAIEAKNFSAFLGLIQMPSRRFSDLSAEDLANLSFIFLSPSAVNLIITDIVIDYAGEQSYNSSVGPHSGRFEIIDGNYNLMAVLASFSSFPGQHQQIFRALYRTGAYDLYCAVQILICSGQFDILRHLLTHSPSKTLKRLNHFKEYDIIANIEPENALEAIETFALFPAFTVFDCLSLLDYFDLTPSSFLAGWIDQNDPCGNVILPRRFGVHLDEFENPIDLLGFAVILENPDLIEFCLNLPQTRSSSIKYAYNLAKHKDNPLLLLTKFQEKLSLRNETI